MYIILAFIYHINAILDFYMPNRKKSFNSTQTPHPTCCPEWQRQRPLPYIWPYIPA